MRDGNKSLSLVVLCVLAVCSRSTLRADSQEDVFVTAGEEFTVSLKSSPGAGYAWYIAESLPSWLVLVDQTWVADNPNVVGGPGTSYWTFRATAPGSVTLTFQYMQPWVGTPVDVHICRITATPPTDTEKVTVAVGEQFKVELRYCVACGYEWVLAGPLPSWLELVSDEQTPDPLPPGHVGGNGTETWTFRATGSGSTTLRFEYRPYQGGTPTKVHLCQVTAVPPADLEKVTVAVGEQFQVELRYCVGCGYEWVLAGSLPSWLELVSDEQTPDPQPPGSVGGMGTEIWTFRATGAGNADLTFEYMRPWEGTPVNVHVCQVTAVPPADPSLVLYLPFDEGAGATAHDRSGYHNPGTVAGAAWVPGVTGKALEFVNGAHVTVPEIPAYDMTDAVSVLAWVKTTQSPNWGRILDKSEYQTSGFDLCLTAGLGLPRFEFFVNNTTSAVDGKTVVADGEWHFLAGTFGNQTLRMYVDGGKEAEAQSAGQVDINPNDWPIMVGAESSSNGGQQYFGSIDEVALYNRELSADEVMAIFRNGVPLRCQPEIDSVKIVRLQAAGNFFNEVGEVNEVTVGDFFTIKIEVTNRGSTPVPRPLLYEWIMSGLGHADVVGDPHCLGLAMPPLQPGESLTLEPLCGGQAFQAATTGWATMDITVGTCHQTFRFEIQPGITPAPCQPEVTDVKIWRGRFVGGVFEKRDQVDKVALGDLFQIKVDVTNRGTTIVNISNLYNWSFSGQGHAEVVGNFCVGVFPVNLAPGESATLDAFCPASQAFQATQAGWATMDITVGSVCHDSFTFEIE
jgi:predicted secreted protein